MRLRANNKPFATVANPVSEDGDYRPVAYWQETVSITPGDPLDGDVSCDVAIVGGGFTGLSAAYELKRAAPSLDVVLLERAVVGHGASGRNGGFVMPLIGWDLPHVRKKLGEDGCEQACRMMHDAVEHTKGMIRDNGIDCDLEETGYLLLATSPAWRKRLRAELDLAHRFGLNHEWLEGTALDEHIRSDAFLAGVYDPRPAVVNPAKLARGIASLVKDTGVRIYEQTPLVELVDGQPIVLRTPNGTVRAKQVVLATNGYSAALGFMPSRVYPVHTYIVLTEPLSNADLAAIGWGAKRASLETARNFIHYFRLTADNRILFGGEDAALYYGGKLLDEHPPTFARLEARFREYFPDLQHVQLTHRWGGVLGVTIDMLPVMGVTGSHGTVTYSFGYSGHGVALGNYAGRLIAPQILERAGHAVDDAPPPFLFGRKPWPLPVEPFRYLGLHLYRIALRAQDVWKRA